MRKMLVLATGVIALAGVSAASAQQAVIISPDNEVMIREYVVRQQVAPVELPPDARIIVGEPLPEAVEVYDLEVPEFEPQYRYVVIDGQTVLVEPESRRIVHILQ